MVVPAGAVSMPGPLRGRGPRESTCLTATPACAPESPTLRWKQERRPTASPRVLT